jgi:hypothetical protein
MRILLLRWARRLFGVMVFGMLAKAGLLILGDLGLHPEESLRDLGMTAFSASWVSWLIAGIAGILVLVFWEWFNLGNRFAQFLPQGADNAQLAQRQSLVDTAFAKLDAEAIALLGATAVAGRPPHGFNDHAWQTLRNERLVVGDFGGPAGLNPDLRPQIEDALRVHAVQSRIASVKALLGNSLRDGERLMRDKASATIVEAWATRLHSLISAAFGAGEADLFLNSSGYVFYGDGSPESQARNYVDGRLRRLTDLLTRVDRLAISANFAPDQWRVP